MNVAGFGRFEIRLLVLDGLGFVAGLDGLQRGRFCSNASPWCLDGSLLGELIRQFSTVGIPTNGRRHVLSLWYWGRSLAGSRLGVAVLCWHDLSARPCSCRCPCDSALSANLSSLSLLLEFTQCRCGFWFSQVHAGALSKRTKQYVALSQVSL